MTVQKQDGLHTDVGESAVDLRGKEDCFCALDATGKVVLAGNGTKISGVISEGRDAGQHTSFNTDGNPILFKFKTQTYDFEIGNINTLGTRNVLSYGGNVRYNAVYSGGTLVYVPQ